MSLIPVVRPFEHKYLGSTQRLGLRINQKCRWASFADHTNENRPDSEWKRFLSDVKSQVLKQVPLVANANGLLTKQHWTNIPDDIKANMAQVLTAIWPDLKAFVNQWPIRAIGILVINTKNKNDKRRGTQLRASDTQMRDAGFTPISVTTSATSSFTTNASSSSATTYSSKSSKKSRKAREPSLAHSSASSSTSAYSTPAFDDAKANTNREAFKKKLQAQPMAETPQTRKKASIEQRRKRLGEPHLPSESDDDSDNNNRRSSTQTIQPCETTGCGNPRDVRVGNTMRKSCRTCLDREKTKNKKQKDTGVQKAQKPFALVSTPLSSIITTKSGRQAQPSQKKRDFSDTLDEVAGNKNHQQSRKRQKLSIRDDSMRISKEIDRLVEDPGRTKQLIKMTKRKSKLTKRVEAIEELEEEEDEDSKDDEESEEE